MNVKSDQKITKPENIYYDIAVKGSARRNAYLGALEIAAPTTIKMITLSTSSRRKISIMTVLYASLVIVTEIGLVIGFSVPPSSDFTPFIILRGHSRKNRKYHPFMAKSQSQEITITNDVLEAAYKNLIDDLACMKSSRVSKFTNNSNTQYFQEAPKRISSGKKKQQFIQILLQNPSLCTLYNDGVGDHYYLTEMTKIVGPMYRRQVEMMIQKHPKLITDILSHLKDQSPLSNRTRKRSKLRSVQEQIIMDLTLSKMDEKRLKLAFEKKSSSMSKLNRNNVRCIFQTFKKIGMTHESLCKIISKAPQLFSYTCVNLQQSISYLKKLELSDEEISRMIVIRPMVLAHCIKEGEKMDSIVQYIQDDLSLDYKNILVRYPQVFELKTHSLKEKVSLFDYDVYFFCCKIVLILLVFINHQK